MLTPELAEQCIEAQRKAALERTDVQQQAGRAWLVALAAPAPETDDERETFAGGPLALSALQRFDR